MPNTAEATTQLISSTGYAIVDAIGSDYDSSISVTGGYLSGAILPIYSDNPQYSKETDRKIIVKVATDAVGFNKNMNDWREYLMSDEYNHIKKRTSLSIAQANEELNLALKKQIWTSEDVELYKAYLNAADKQLNIIRKRINTT